MRGLLLVVSFAHSPASVTFEQWTRLYEKTYTLEMEEYEARRAFAENDRIIELHNVRGRSFALGHNKYSDMTSSQFAKRMSVPFSQIESRHTKHFQRKEPSRDVPDHIDWVAKGAVTPIKDQAQCGSCWAFSAIASIEGAYAINTGTLISLSEEELVQCDHNGDEGCDGGLMDNAFTWIEDHPLCTEDAYPYTSGTGITGQCSLNCTARVTITSFADIPPKDEDALQQALASHPVSVGIDASLFQLYKSGVIDDSACGTMLDHGVCIVGYGTDVQLDKDYWKVKNSWGKAWGEAGYVRVVRNKNMCGIAMQASFPTGVSDTLTLRESKTMILTR